jgi:hypothetical protein
MFTQNKYYFMNQVNPIIKLLPHKIQVIYNLCNVNHKIIKDYHKIFQVILMDMNVILNKRIINNLKNLNHCQKFLI